MTTTNQNNSILALEVRIGNASYSGIGVNAHDAEIIKERVNRFLSDEQADKIHCMPAPDENLGAASLEEVYCTFRDMYGIMHRSWDMTHDITRYPVTWDNDFDLFHEYEVWKALLPIFKQHDVAYYLGIDDFVKNYGAWLRRKYVKTT